MPTNIEAPSGLTGVVRGLTGRDGRFLTDLKVSRANLIPDYILKNTWETTLDAGPYQLEAGGGLKAPNWELVLVGDRDSTLIDVRVASYGELYEFPIQCRNAGCKTRFSWTIDLTELPRKKLAKADAEIFIAGNEFHGVVPGTSKEIVYKLAIGRDIQRAAAARKERKLKGKKAEADSNLLIESVLMRIVKVPGIEEKNPGRRRELFRDWLEDLEMRSVMGLLDLFDEHDCGVRTNIAVCCTECDQEFDVQLPFEGDFFFPRKSSPAVGSTIQRPKTETSSEDPEEEAPEPEEEGDAAAQ